MLPNDRPQHQFKNSELLLVISFSLYQCQGILKSYKDNIFQAVKLYSVETTMKV